MLSNYASADFSNNAIEFNRYSGSKQEIDLNWLYDFVDTITTSDKVGYDSKTGLTYVVLSGQVVLIDTSNPTSKQF